MFALNFDLGFCRDICKNGIIFGKRNIEFKYKHSKRGTDPNIEFNLRAGELATLEAQFIEALVNLKRFYVPRNVMWALACKVFRIKLRSNELIVEKTNELIVEKQKRINELKKKYFDKLGENGYAALNVLTVFASRPVGVISQENRIDKLQKYAGEWIEDFVFAIESRDFTFESYLGDHYQWVS